MVTTLAPTVGPTKMPPVTMVFTPVSVSVTAPAVLKCNELQVAPLSLSVTVVMPTLLALTQGGAL